MHILEIKPPKIFLPFNKKSIIIPIFLIVIMSYYIIISYYISKKFVNTHQLSYVVFSSNDCSSFRIYEHPNCVRHNVCEKLEHPNK